MYNLELVTSFIQCMASPVIIYCGLKKRPQPILHAGTKPKQTPKSTQKQTVES